MPTLATKEKKIARPLMTPQVPEADRAHVEQIFTNVQEHMGFVPDGLRLFSMSPPLLDSFMGNIGYFSMGGTALPQTLTTMIRYLVSWDAGCSFCVDMNEGFLTNMGLELDAIRATRDNPDKAPFDAKDKALLKLALKAIDNPDNVAADDLDAVRKHGWGDREIFDAIVQAANNRAFNYVLRTFNIEHQGAYA